MASKYISDQSQIQYLDCSKQFKQLTTQEKMYSFHFYNGIWESAKICLFQRSHESPGIFMLLQLTFQQDINLLRQKFINLENGNENLFNKILVYSAAFFKNCGNYSSFGDSKFIPEVDINTFEQFFKCSHNYNNNYQCLMDQIWSQVQNPMFSSEGKYEKIDFPDKEGFSGYYSNNLKSDEINDIDELLQILNISELNTRVIKNGNNFYVLQASGNKNNTLKHHYKGKNVIIVSGEFSPFLKRLCQQLEKALQYASNDNQTKMIEKYIQTFTNGDIDSHKESQRYWVKDQGPVIETNLGFIETYLDPRQIRAEWEGFVAVVDKEVSKKTLNLVNNAQQLLEKYSAWPKEFEKDSFLKPDFTSLSVLAFASSGTPLGINIPNYDDIRQDYGFKNVFLSNVQPTPTLESIQFFDIEDSKLLVKYHEQISFSITSFHELLGHGCGKLFMENNDGELNFDIKNVIHPITKKGITSWYKSNDSWQNVFQGFSNPYEECRAESMALYFSCIREAQEIILPENVQDFDEILYAIWLDFAYAGVKSLAYYNVDEMKFGQAHMRASYVILQVLLEAGNNFLQVELSQKDGQDWILIKLDREQILTTGLQAIKQFLMKLNVYKCTADVQEGKKMFDGYSQVDEKFKQIRQIVLNNKRPRRLELQGHLKLESGQVNYVEFSKDFQGIVESYMQRYPYFDEDMLNYWNLYKNEFQQQH